MAIGLLQGRVCGFMLSGRAPARIRRISPCLRPSLTFVMSGRRLQAYKICEFKKTTGAS
jgi:hypothetical protein